MAKVFLKRSKMAKNSVKVVKQTKVKILLPVAGKYNLSANVGEEVVYPASLATELVEDKYAEFVK